MNLYDLNNYENNWQLNTWIPVYFYLLCPQDIKWQTCKKVWKLWSANLYIYKFPNYIRYLFQCNQWLSKGHSDGKISRYLEPEDMTTANSFNSLLYKNLFEEHLWLSVSKRPTMGIFRYDIFAVLSKWGGKMNTY